MNLPSTDDGATPPTLVLNHDIRIPNDNLLTAAARRQWANATLSMADAAVRNEATLAKRRIGDQSAFTLDNAFRQFVPPDRHRPLMSDIMCGAFMEGPRARVTRDEAKIPVRRSATAANQRRPRTLFA